MWGEIDYIEEIEWGDNWEEERMGEEKDEIKINVDSIVKVIERNILRWRKIEEKGNIERNIDIEEMDYERSDWIIKRLMDGKIEKERIWVLEKIIGFGFRNVWDDVEKREIG